MIVPYFQGHGDSGISAHPRGGDWHLRIYDDEFKHQKIKGCSRWAIEGELRGVQATHFADMFKASTDDKGLMASVLATKLKNDGLNFPIFDELKAVKISGTKPTTDLDGKIFALRTTGSNQMAKVIEAERPAALIAWFRSNGWLDEQGRFLHGMATEEQIRDEQEIWVRDLEPRKNRVPELSEIQKEEIKELVRIAGHTRQLRSNPSKWIDEDPFSDE